MDRFRDLFLWNGERLQDVRFWCEPELTTEAIKRIEDLSFSRFDGFASFEARGFFLSGIASSIYQLPVVPIRKHKKFYDKIPHSRVSFTNWKNEEESLTIINKTLPDVRKVLIIDDILDTGRSLSAGCELLRELNVEVVGAYYLLDARSSDINSHFKFPVYSLLKHKLL